MTFAQLKSKLLGTNDAPGLAFPLGTPENLRPQCEAFIVEALIEIQRYIPCWQTGHYDVHRASEVMVSNGCSVITCPTGQISEVFTITTSDDGSGWEHPIPYVPVDLQYLRRWMGRFRSSFRFMGQEFTSAMAGSGYRLPSVADNSPFGRALSGVWSIDKLSNRLIIAPWLQSDESVVVAWTGIKRTWSDADVVSDNPDFIRLVKLWLLQEFGRHWASSDLATRVDTWATAQADSIVECQHNQQLPMRGGSPEEVEAAKAFYSANPPVVPVETTFEDVPTRICFVGDTGTADANAEAVAALVEAQNPDLVVLLGDVKYPPNSAETALAPYSTLIGSGKLVTALGNHDLDGDAGASVLAVVNNPGNERYFSVRAGPVEVFVINDGLNTAGAYVEEDGSFMGSVQWAAIKGMILRSCAAFKVVVLHHAPFTSGTRYSPGLLQMRWVSDLEVHAVIAAHSHNYERGDWRGRQHFVVGTGGGSPQDGFVDSPDPESKERITGFGALLLSATKTEAKFEFLDLGDVVLDTITIKGWPTYALLSESPTLPPDWSVGLPLAPVFRLSPASQRVFTGSVVSMHVVVAGTPPISLQWKEDGIAIPGATSLSYSLTASRTAFYTVVATNIYGSSESSPGMVLLDVLAQTTFATVADMTASNPLSWATAECENNAPGDDYMSFWIRSGDETRLPNGIDILQSNGPVNPGISLVRIFVREPSGGVVLPGPGLPPYTVDVPVVVATIEDLQNSIFTAPLVWVGDESNPIVFRQGNTNDLDDGVNGVLNRSGIHYDRIQFV